MGYAQETIHGQIQELNQVSKTVDINQPQEVKTWLADTTNEHHYNKPCKWKNSSKKKFVAGYTAYLKYKKIQWEPPHYNRQPKLPFIPTEEEIDQLIASCGYQTATILQTLKETGIRIGELTQLKPTDLDTQRKTLNITPEKGSNPRILPISDKLINMITKLHKDPRAKYTTLFQNNKNTLRDYLTSQRKTAATKLNNPRLQQITFHTFRHWKGTMEYHDKKDILHVKSILGHKDIDSTMIYINLEQALFLQPNDKFISKVAHNEQEELSLIEAGFEHVNNRDNLSFYRKRK